VTPRGSVGQRSGVFLASRIVGSAGFLVAVVVLAHAVDQTGRGAIAFVTVTALSVSAIARFGVGDATLVLAARAPGSRGVFFSNLIVWTFGSAVAGAALAAAALLLAGDRRPVGIETVEIVAIGLGVILTAFVDAGYTMLLSTGRVREQGLITAAGPWLYAALLAIAWRTGGLTIAFAATIWVFSQGIWAASVLIVGLRGVGVRRPNASLLKAALAFGVQAWGGSLAGFLNARLDQLLVAVLASTRSLGDYAVAVNAAEIVLYVPTAAAQALMSAVAGDEATLRTRRVTRAFRAALLATCGLVVLAAISGPVLLPVVFGRQYAVSVVPFLILLPGAFGFVGMSVFSTGLLLASSPRLASIGPAAALIAGTGLDLILIPAFDVVGAALASSAALLIGGAVASTLYRVRTGATFRSFVPGSDDVRSLSSLAATMASLRPRHRSP